MLFGNFWDIFPCDFELYSAEICLQAFSTDLEVTRDHRIIES